MCVKLLGDVGKKKFTKGFLIWLKKQKKNEIGFTVKIMHFFNILTNWATFERDYKHHSLFNCLLSAFYHSFHASFSLPPPFCSFFISRYLLDNHFNWIPIVKTRSGSDQQYFGDTFSQTKEIHISVLTKD